MSSPGNDRSIIIPVDKTNFSLDDGRLILDPLILPAVCPACGGDGTVSQLLRIKAPYDVSFWLGIGGLLGAPLLFGLGAGLVYVMFGNEALASFVPYGMSIAILGAIIGGLNMSKSNRENWFLTFHFCQRCLGQYKKLIFVSRSYAWGAIAVFLILMFLPVIGQSLRMSQEAMQFMAYALLTGMILVFGGFVSYRIRMASFRRLRARWKSNHKDLSISLGNPAALEAVNQQLESKAAIFAALEGGQVASEERSNDEVYNELRNIALNDEAAAFKSDGEEIRLLGRLGNLTQQSFLRQVDPFMTRERAAFVRRLRVDEGLTWRGIAEAWQEQFEEEADWKFNGNQLAGMALCEAAARYFNEDYMASPWNE